MFDCTVVLFVIAGGVGGGGGCGGCGDGFGGLDDIDKLIGSLFVSSSFEWSLLWFGCGGAFTGVTFTLGVGVSGLLLNEFNTFDSVISSKVLVFRGCCCC